MGAVEKGVLRRIAALRADGLSYHAIAAALNRLGHPAPLGGRWYGNSVRQALHKSMKAAARVAPGPKKVLASPDQPLFDAWHARPVAAPSINHMHNLPQELPC